METLLWKVKDVFVFRNIFQPEISTNYLHVIEVPKHLNLLAHLLVSIKDQYFHFHCIAFSCQPVYVSFNQFFRASNTTPNIRISLSINQSISQINYERPFWSANNSITICIGHTSTFVFYEIFSRIIQSTGNTIMQVYLIWHFSTKSLILA